MKTYSFIIPHHNTPDLLQRLIDTIPQRDDIEIIVVDDNSDYDKKANISRPDVKTIFIDKEHTNGAGKARNVGMDAATGKWLLFADADDLYKDDDIEILYFNVETVDNITLQVVEEYRSRFHQKQFEMYDDTKEGVDNFLFWGYGPWRKMIYKNFVYKYEIRWEETPIGNDSFFALQTSYFVKNWKKDNRILYSLSFNKHSLTYSPISPSKWKTYIYMLPRRREFFKYIGHANWNKQSLKGHYSQSSLLYILKLTKRNVLVGIKAFFFYFFHLISIEKNSSYYVDTIKEIEKKIK